MRRQPADDYKKLVPLKRIAETSSYSLGYVSILVQRKKLKAKKIGNKYYSTKEWFDQYLELHARDEKRLSPEVARELSLNKIADKKTASQAVAAANLKTRIDNLVERAIKEKLEAQAIQEKLQVFKAEKATPFYQADEILSALDSLTAKPDSLITAGQIDKKAAEEKQPAFFASAEKDLASSLAISLDQEAAPAAEPKNLENILEEKIPYAPAGPIDDSVDPEIRLATAWQKSFVREKKDLLKQQRVIVRKIKSQARQRTLAAIAQTFIARPLVLKTSAAALMIVLAAAALTYFAPALSADLNRGVRQAVSRTAAQVKRLAVSGLSSKYLNQAGAPLKPAKEFLTQTNAEVVIPGSGLAEQAKASLNNVFLNLSGRVSAFSLQLENTARSGQEYLTIKLAGPKNLKNLKNQTIAQAQVWRGKLISQIARLAQEKVQPVNLPDGQAGLVKAGDKPEPAVGAAASLAESRRETPSATSTLARLLALANQAGRVLGITEGEPEVFRSENYQIKQMNFGGEMIFLSDENIALPLAISEVRSESATDLKGEINKLLVFWNTNKLATTELSYFRAGESETSARKIKDNNYSFSHSAALSDLDKSTVYNFMIKATDRWGNVASSNRFAAYSGAKPISIFQLIINTLEESFNWAIKEETNQNQ